MYFLKHTTFSLILRKLQFSMKWPFYIIYNMCKIVHSSIKNVTNRENESVLSPACSLCPGDLKNPEHFLYGEETFIAWKEGRLTDDIKEEHRKVIEADIIIFQVRYLDNLLYISLIAIPFSLLSPHHIHFHVH